MATPRLWRTAALCGVLALAAVAQQGPYEPYQERLTGGAVNWDEGWIRADATIPLRADIPPAQARVEAQRVAMIKAQATALRIAMRIPVNSEQRVESFEAIKVRIKGIVSGGQVVHERQRGKDYLLSLQVPINGVTGIMAEVSKVTLPQTEPQPAAPPSGTPQAAKPPAESTGPTALAPVDSVTVDATSAGVKPALQPRILDPQGKEIYSVKTVKPLVAREKTLARYVVPSGTTPAQPASWVGPDSLSGLPLALASPPWRILAQRAPTQRPRGEAASLQVTAAASAGSLKADIVVTEETARKLREAEAASGVLSQGNVVVVVRADVGGVESRRLRPEGPDARELALR